MYNKYSAEHSDAHDIWWIEDEAGVTVCDFYYTVGAYPKDYFRFVGAEKNCKHIVELLNVEHQNANDEKRREVL